MRQHLINCLTEDVAPEIRRTGDPEASILKVANAKNFAPAQVEAMGQLYNTIKTLRFLDKSASRGGTFPILDVPAMVSKYLQTTGSEKSARARGPAAYDQLMDDPATGLPACFANVDPARPQYVADTSYEEKPVKVKFASAPDQYDRVELEAIHVIRDEYLDKARNAMYKIAAALKQSAYEDTQPYTFKDLDRDMLYVYGDKVRPMMDKLACFLEAERIKVARAENAGPIRLFRDTHLFMPKMASLEEALAMVDSANGFIKESHAAAVREKTDSADTLNAVPEGGGSAAPARRGVPVNGGGKPPGGRPAPNGKPSGGGGDGAQSFFGNVAGMAEKGYGQVRKVLGNAGSIVGSPMAGQKHVDRSEMEARHLSVLHNLLTTDDVLADADPDKVVEAYNTIRENAPEVATDINVMRVALRSAVQHDGISPFDLKTFLDVEGAKQKVDSNRQLMDSVRYNGREMGLPSKVA